MLLLKEQKGGVLPLRNQKILSTNKSTTFHERTIGAMFTAAQINRTVDPLQLTETVLPQSSPQLAGPSPFERPVRFQLKPLTIGTFTC